ncbi:MAG: restriction endonuclease [Cyanobacteria bacterium J06639_16]
MIERNKVDSSETALQELGNDRSNPPWLENNVSLPFTSLSPDEFEIFCYLLLKLENPEADIYYYGKTGDAGRDIIIKRTDGSTELVQCKRYERNIGPAETRSEILKIYTNVRRKIIPEKPDIVTFYVAPDFTPKAKDLIVYSEKRSELVDQEFSAEDQNFFPEWQPEFKIQTSIDLTQRAHKFQDLINSFFTVRSVVDNTAVERNHRDILLAIKELKEISLRQSSPNTPETIQAQLDRVGEDNPGLDFSLTHTSSKIPKLTVTSKGNSVDFAKLIFPSTDSGNRGITKFKSLVEEGRAIELKPDEYDWQWTIKLSDFSPIPCQIKELVLKPNIPITKIPCKLEILDDDKPAFEISFSYFHISRIGTKEIECCINQGQLHGNLKFVSKIEESLTYLEYEGIDLCSVEISQAKIIVELMMALYEFRKIRVVSLENGEILIDNSNAKIINNNLGGEQYRVKLEFIKSIQKINHIFGLDLRYPQSIDSTDLKEINALLEIVEKGRIERTEGHISLSYSPQQALNIIDQFDNSKEYDLEFAAAETEIKLLGEKINLGSTKYVLKDIYLKEDIELLKQKFTRAKNSGIETVDLGLDYSKSIEIYSNWIDAESKG